ncbi:hypothetical protein [uncultured Veillonella sp.]|uniref:hypothetical protein n=1 Tax=uncultured Veillonella sp. TaxID=159268 RepID=UPI00261779D6|nr:hypothetical protein [uncultured Veillonella sp.]
MGSGLVLCLILLFIYTIYIIRNNTINIAGVQIKRSSLLLSVQLLQMFVILLLFSFGGSFIHSTSIFMLILAGLFISEMFVLKRDLNKYFIQAEGKYYGLAIIGIRHLVVFIVQSILLILFAIYYW